jgi:hypothetical protein
MVLDPYSTPLSSDCRWAADVNDGMIYCFAGTEGVDPS